MEISQYIYLEAMALCLILVLSIQRLNVNVVGKRVPQSLAALDIQLDVYRKWCPYITLN